MTAVSKLRCRSRRQASNGATSPAAFSAVEANQRAQQAWSDAADRLEQALPVVGQVKTHGGNHVDIEVVETGSGGLCDAALSNDVGSVFGGEQQNAAGSSEEAPQAGRAGRDGDCEVESEKGFAALWLSNADRLLAPQLFDEPAPLLRLFGEFRGPTGGESIHDRAPLRLSGVKISKNSFSSSSVALGGRGEQAVGREGAVVAGGMKGVLKALRHEIRVAGLLEEVVEAGGEFLSFGVGQALGGTPEAATRRAAACR